MGNFRLESISALARFIGDSNYFGDQAELLQTIITHAQRSGFIDPKTHGLDFAALQDSGVYLTEEQRGAIARHICNAGRENTAA